MSEINIGCNSLVIKDNKILLGLRKNVYGEGTWGLPGGHLNSGELIIDAVKRELKEEAGIEAEELEFCSIIDQGKNEKHYIQINFIIKSFTGEIKNIEPQFCDKLEWFDLNKLPEKIFPPHIKILEAHRKQLTYGF